jgi:hypothetical protein
MSPTAPIWFVVQINSAHIVQHKSHSVNSEEATFEGATSQETAGSGLRLLQACRRDALWLGDDPVHTEKAYVNCAAWAMSF